MTSSNGNILRVTGHLRGEFTGPRWIPQIKASDAEFDVFFDLRLNKRLSKKPWGWWFETPSRPLWRHCNESGVKWAAWRLKSPAMDCLFSLWMLTSKKTPKHHTADPLYPCFYIFRIPWRLFNQRLRCRWFKTLWFSNAVMILMIYCIFDYICASFFLLHMYVYKHSYAGVCMWNVYLIYRWLPLHYSLFVSFSTRLSPTTSTDDEWMSNANNQMKYFWYRVLRVWRRMDNLKSKAKSLQWRHDGRHGVSTHRRLYRLLNRLFRRWSK